MNEVCPVAECINSGNSSDISSLMLCNGCMTNILSNNDARELFSVVQRKVRSNGRTKITDCNEDVLMN